MLTFRNKYARNYVYSQNGEEGILEECIIRMKPKHKVLFEFGCNNGQWCSNTALLVKKYGWEGSQYEIESDLFVQAREFFKHDRAMVYNIAVTPKNINYLMSTNCFIASFDSDGRNDYECLQALTYCPPILIIEINSALPPLEDHVGEGANYSAMVKLAQTKGYFVLCHTGNLVLLQGKYAALFPEVQGHPLIDVESYFDYSWIKK